MNAGNYPRSDRRTVGGFAGARKNIHEQEQAAY